MKPATGRGTGDGGRGFTLAELIVVLAILGLMLGISGLALVSLRPRAKDDAVRELLRARAEAIRTGRAVQAQAPSSATLPASPFPLPLFLPDGRALGPGVDPLTGAPRAQP